MMKTTTLSTFFPLPPPSQSFPKRVSKIIVPPIKCQGIKTKIVRFILSKIQWNGKGTWFEPFLGSGVVLFNASPTKAIASDINPNIPAFYNALKNDTVTAMKMKRFLDSNDRNLKEGGRSFFESARSEFNKTKDPFWFIFLSRSCYNGLMRFNLSGKFNASFCHEPDRFDDTYVTKITNQVRRVHEIVKTRDYTFECNDWRDVVKNAGKDDFVYLDPPYSGRNTGYFGEWKEKDDADIISFMQHCTCKFALSTWKGDDVKQNEFFKTVMESGKFRVETTKHFYHVGPTEEERHPVIEALIMNDG
jgi:DNA adenine methylase